MFWLFAAAALLVVGEFFWLAASGVTVFWWVLAGLAVLATLYSVTSVRLVRPGRQANIERFGQLYRGPRKPGVYALVPFVDRMMPPIDMREQEIAVKADVVTSDNIDVTIDSAIFFRVKDARAAAYRVWNYPRMIERLAATVLRNVVAGQSLEAFLISRHATNDAVLREVRSRAGNWGIKIISLEIMVVEIPEAIKHAMEERKSVMLRADGEAHAIDTLADAIQGVPGPYQKFVVSEYLRNRIAAVRAHDGADGISSDRGAS